MGHQCLQCGNTFPDGSQELLKGCACGGSRFYYTTAPLDVAEREALMAKANLDLKQVIQELVQGKARPDYEDPLWSMESREAWLKVGPGGVERIAPDLPSLPSWRGRGKHRAAREPVVLEAVPDPSPVQPVPPPKAAAPAKAAQVLRKPAQQVQLPVADEAAPPKAPLHATRATAPPAAEQGPREPKPEVVVVQEPGSYAIDVEQLLEHSPVVIRRDGVYVVHLPSVFSAAGRK